MSQNLSTLQEEEPQKSQEVAAAAQEVKAKSLSANWLEYVPGIVLCGVITAVAMVINRVVPVISALLVAIVLGALVANLSPLSTRMKVGVGFSAKHLLRIGIVLLGLQISIRVLAGLGWQTLVLVVMVVTIGVLSTLAIGKAMGIPFRLTALVACGFSICGAAAVAGAKETVNADEEDTATALALVVVFGTLAIPVTPALASLFKLDPTAAGTWIGGCVHEVAQVVAAASALGEDALQIAVIVKLARVVCLAGVMAGFGIAMRKSKKISSTGKRPPLVPGFVIGFLAMVLVASIFTIPAGVASVVKTIQTLLLSMAMAGLGCGINVRQLVKVGLKPVGLGFVATVIVFAVSLAGVLLIN